MLKLAYLSVNTLVLLNTQKVLEPSSVVYIKGCSRSVWRCYNRSSRLLAFGCLMCATYFRLRQSRISLMIHVCQTLFIQSVSRLSQLLGTWRQWPGHDDCRSSVIRPVVWHDMFRKGVAVRRSRPEVSVPSTVARVDRLMLLLLLLSVHSFHSSLIILIVSAMVVTIFQLRLFDRVWVQSIDDC